MDEKNDFLHVEDDQSWRENFEELAKNLGVPIRQFTGKKQALVALRAKAPTHLITDLHLTQGGDQDGYEIAQVAVDAGVKHVVIASETGTPSRRIEGVEIMDKVGAVKWLRSRIKG